MHLTPKYADSNCGRYKGNSVSIAGAKYDNTVSISVKATYRFRLNFAPAKRGFLQSARTRAKYIQGKRGAGGLIHVSLSVTVSKKKVMTTVFLNNKYSCSNPALYCHF